MPRGMDFKQTLCADNNGFSLHAAVRLEHMALNLAHGVRAQGKQGQGGVRASTAARVSSAWASSHSSNAVSTGLCWRCGQRTSQ